jgi:hypothetical protein
MFTGGFSPSVSVRGFLPPCYLMESHLWLELQGLPDELDLLAPLVLLHDGEPQRELRHPPAQSPSPENQIKDDIREHLFNAKTTEGKFRHRLRKNQQTKKKPAKYFFVIFTCA